MQVNYNINAITKLYALILYIQDIRYEIRRKIMDENALYQITMGLFVLGAKDNNRFVGSIVDAVMQVANKPLILALSCTNNSFTKSCIDNNGKFSLSVTSIACTNKQTNTL